MFDRELYRTTKHENARVVLTMRMYQVNKEEGQEQEAQSHRESVLCISIYPDMSIHHILEL